MRFAIIENSHIVNAVEADVQAQVATAAGQTVMAWDAAIAAYPVGGALAPSAVDLTAYANARQWATATGGRVLTLAGQQVRFATADTSLSLIAGKVARLQQSNPPATVNWQTGETTFIAIAAADFIAAAIQIADFVQATFDALQSVFAAIATGSITTTAQIDQVFAAI